MAGERQLIVKIVGDDKSLQAAFARSTASTKAFASNVNRSLSGGVSVGKSFDPLLGRVKESQARADELSKRLAALDDTAAGGGVDKLGAGLGAVALRAGIATVAINATYQGARHLQDALQATGAEAFTTEGKLRNLAASLLSGDVVGGLQALRAQPKTLEDLGISAVEASNRMAALSTVAHANVDALREQSGQSDEGAARWNAYTQAVDEAGTGSKRLAQELINQVAAIQAADNAQNALADSTSRLGSIFRTSTGDAVAFKGAVDDIAGPRGPGLVDQINAAFEQSRGGRFGRPAGRPIGPSARNAAAQTVAQASGDLNELLRLQKIERDRAAKAFENSHGNVKQRTRLNQALAASRAAVITTERAITAQGEAEAKAAEAARKAAAAAAKAAARAKAAKLREHWQAVIASLDLGVARAELTPALSNDLAALRSLKAGLEAQIRAGQDVTAAQTRVAGVVGEIAKKQAEIKQKAAEAVQRSQFRALGLSATGDEIIPGAKNLAKRFESLSDRIAESGAQIGTKLAERFKLAGKEIRKEGDNLKKDVRETIDGIFKDVNDKLRETGPDIRTVSLSDKILRALGFSKDPDVGRFTKPSAPFATAATVPDTSKLFRELSTTTGNTDKRIADLGTTIELVDKRIKRLFVVGSPKGLVQPGNIDLLHRPIAHNKDGSISTVRSITVEIGKNLFALLPTVFGSGDKGRVVSNREAIDAFMRTRKNLGLFSSEAAADRYSMALHREQAQYYSRANRNLRSTQSTELPPVHVHVHVDRREIGDVLIRDLQKRGGRTTATSGGRYAGRSLGLA